MILIDTPGRIMGVVGFVVMLIGTIALSTEFWQALLASSVFGIFMMLLASKYE